MSSQQNNIYEDVSGDREMDGMDPFGEDELFDMDGTSKSSHWSVAWSDLMMTMFIFFVVLYVYQAANRELNLDDGPGKTTVSEIGSGAVLKIPSGDEYDPITELQPSIVNVYKKTRMLFDRGAFEDHANVDIVGDQAVRIILAGDLLFDTGKAQLRERGRNSLAQVASVIRQTSCFVNVVGHTDNVPIHSGKFETNWELSAVRACVVARYLIENMRIPGERFYVTGHAWHRPVKPNDNIKNRSANRRVEIILTKEKPGGASSGETVYRRL